MYLEMEWGTIMYLCRETKDQGTNKSLGGTWKHKEARDVNIEARKIIQQMNVERNTG